MKWAGVTKYLLAVTFVAMAVIARWLLDPMLGQSLPLTIVYAGVAVAVWFSGWRPATVAALVGLCFSLYLLLPPLGSFEVSSAEGVISVAAYLAFCSLIIGVGETARRSYARTFELQHAAVEHEQQTATIARQLLLITDALPALIAYVDAQGRYQFNNRAYEEWFGYSREAIRGKHLREVLGAEAYERIRPHAEAAFSGRHAHFDDDVPYKDAGTRHVHADYVPDIGADGTVAGFYVLVSDLTERRRAETQLRESELRFRMLADSSPALIWVNGLEGNEFVNRELLEFFGTGPDELRGNKWVRFVHPDDLPQYVVEFQNACDQRIPFEREVRLQRHDGEYRWMRVVARPRFNANGEYLGHAGIAIDMSDWRIAEQRMIQSERMAAVGNLAAGLSHDMANLIMPMEAAISVLKEAPQTDVSSHAIETAERCTRSLNDLVKGVRQLVRTGCQSQEPQLIHLQHWWHRSESLLRSSIPKRIRISSDFGPQPLYIKVVEGELMRAVLNLMVNAAEAIGDAQIHDGRIHFSGRLGPDGSTVELAVSDNGPGIPPHLQAKIFEPFFSTKTSGLSTGMGMSIIQDFVDRARGSISLQSSPGQGTTFVMRLPAATPEASILCVDARQGAQRKHEEARGRQNP